MIFSATFRNFWPNSRRHRRLQILRAAVEPLFVPHHAHASPLQIRLADKEVEKAIGIVVAIGIKEKSI
uniref:Uncharacterized protein n=1 Tax=Rhizobium leguminosarum TaxID=384 RepID=A0A179BWH1_RHILE|nr:hypothetical protein A4U53_15575 [Rhizobium leguminosarum]